MKKRNRVVISGFFGSPNVGDEAVCLAVVEGIRRVFEGVDISVVTRNAEVSKNFTCSRVDYIQCFYPMVGFWRKLPRLIRAVGDAHLVVIGGGGLFQDVHSWSTPLCHLLSASLALLFSVPACIVGLGVGPIKRAWIRKIIGRTANRFCFLGVRDEYSAQEMVDCGVPREKISVGADVVPGLFREHIAACDRPAEETGLVGVSLRRWPGLDMHSVAELLGEIVNRGKKIRLLCFEPEPDKIFYSEILELCSSETRRNCEVFYPTTFAQSVEAIRESDFLIAMRLHACILAGVQGVPFLPVSYDRKVREFCSQIGIPELVVEVGDVNSSLAAKLDQIQDYWDENRSRIDSGIDDVKSVSSGIFDELAGCCEGPKQWGSRLVGLRTFALIVFLGILMTGWVAVHSLRRLF
ncbi:MAG: polysaccharide pyruvyl transferase family protein [Sedimentisphaerales bacterium]|nr:polysaccharide pyruvyl transferase family protein [Sedimentisphaerales bacterium]